MTKYSQTLEKLNKHDNLSFYILGSFITDGNVHKDKSRKGSFKSSLSSKDEDWLLSINNSLGNEGKLRKDKSGNKNMYSLWFYNKEIFDWLVFHDCVPNKSLIVKLPNIPDEYFSSFMLGCIDGDGCICRSKYLCKSNKKYYEQTSISLCGASPNFMLPLSEKLTNLGFEHSFLKINNKNGKIKDQIILAKHPIYRIQFSGHKKATNFLKWLYSTSNFLPKLNRKFELAESIINDYSSKDTY
jgi:hypothetical protein